jgi:aryl-alcohol dehydrogenase-like predicted oxidoreductase
MQGLLTGKYHSADEMPPIRTRTRHFRGSRMGSRHGEAGAEEEVFAAIEGMRSAADKLQVPMAQLALGWIISHPEITCVLAGIRSAKQLEENAAAAQLKLPTEIIEHLNQLTDPVLKKLGASPDYYQASGSSRTW